jgi:hypothetical protein
MGVLPALVQCFVDCVDNELALFVFKLWIENGNWIAFDFESASDNARHYIEFLKWRFHGRSSNQPSSVVSWVPLVPMRRTPFIHGDFFLSPVMRAMRHWISLSREDRKRGAMRILSSAIALRTRATTTPAK